MRTWPAQTALAAFAALVALLSGCRSDPWSPAEERALEAAEATWSARAPSSYVLEYRESCFCPPADTQWMRITVRDGVVEDVVYADSLAVRHPSPARWPTVDTLFARLDRLQRNPGAHVADVEASFDATLGYPERIAVVMEADVVDGGIVSRVRSLAPLP